MGNSLSTPSTYKRQTSGEDARLLYSVVDMQGWRYTMEDAHAAVLSLDGGAESSNAFFAVYDGHCGRAVATFAGTNVHKRLLTEEAYREKRYEEALKRAFLGTDEDLLASPDHAKDPSGCTAVAALITSDGKIYTANAGDSRSVISVKGEVKPLSFDHKPSDQAESDRIYGARGFIDNNRVNGKLALSRALGDFRFKKNTSLIPEKQIITADPDVTIHEITEEDEFLVIACDGIWECLSSQQVVDFVRLKVSEGKELNEICETICDHCMAPDTAPPSHGHCCSCDRCSFPNDYMFQTGTGCDNMTVLIVAILNGRTKDEWYAWVTDRVKQKYGYDTPGSIPRLYSQARLDAYNAQQKAQQERDRREEIRTKMEQDRIRAEQDLTKAEQDDSDSGLPRTGSATGEPAEVGTVDVSD